MSPSPKNLLEMSVVGDFFIAMGKDKKVGWFVIFLVGEVAMIYLLSIR